MRIIQRIHIEREVSDVFALISDPSRYPDFFVGVTRWKPLSRARRKGARFRVLMAVGSIEAGGTVRVVEWNANESIAWKSETGIDQVGRWDLWPTDVGTELQLAIQFELSGPASWLVERLAGRTVARNMWATLLAARRLLETE